MEVNRIELFLIINMLGVHLDKTLTITAPSVAKILSSLSLYDICHSVYYTHTYLILQSGFQVSIGQPLSLNRYLLLFIHNQILWFDPWQQIYRPIPASELQYCHRSSLPGSGNKILSGTLCEISLFQFPRV